MKSSAILPEFKSFAQMITALPDNDSCRKHLEKVRWNSKPVCPFCACEKSYKLKTKGEFKGMYKCADCKARYNVKIGTIFEGTHLPLRKWFIAIFLFGSHKKGISSHQLAEDLGITQKSAWYMLCRIRHLYQEEKHISDSPAYCDETFVGGKNKNRHRDKKVEKSQGRSFKDKTPVFGMIQDGKIFTQVIPDTKKSSIYPILSEILPQGSILVTDEWKAYKGMHLVYDHKIVNHAYNQYVSEDGYSTNNVENFWSHLKRGIYGIYHKVSPKHLQRYCDEFAFRFNHRSMEPAIKFDLSLVMSERGRLRYRTLIEK